MPTARCPSLGSSADLAVYGENRQPVSMSDRAFDLVIFDCDGVLVDSEPIINRAHAQVLTACGYPITEDDLLARFCGMNDAEMLATIEHERGRQLPPSYAERVGAMIEAGFGQSLVAIAGVAEALDSLRLPVCVASSSVPEQIRRKLELTGLLTRVGEDLLRATMVCAASRRPICSSMPRSSAQPPRTDVWSSRTARSVSRRQSLPE
jgi:Haloacid dehalogenase-like hydrolase